MNEVMSREDMDRAKKLAKELRKTIRSTKGEMDSADSSGADTE